MSVLENDYKYAIVVIETNHKYISKSIELIFLHSHEKDSQE